MKTLVLLYCFIAIVYLFVSAITMVSDFLTEQEDPEGM